ncbi:hypothetical protein EI42_00493 [Thermosporothrix hazakensis]|uniref:Protein kinase domain-containing protein n=3 Tax=Thermosporothrix TaxID=768650 RepID=A0A326UQI7_THEHA|nr:hypothetical protein EI42_00493 [Thermosporothrix hazakensis]BBH88785.1 hypothetical protein KTC_35360 [Thermosporothrix sp. COM3]GCE46968.1 hypothetical protein KTH_18370 [Thermosporothrix hazakensis]
MYCGVVEDVHLAMCTNINDQEEETLEQAYARWQLSLIRTPLDLSFQDFCSAYPDGTDTGEPLRNGDIILDGCYCIEQLLYQRPRVNLYLGRRVGSSAGGDKEFEPLVAIREVVLVGLDPLVRDCIENALLEEAQHSTLFCPVGLPLVSERVLVEGGRYYLIIRLQCAYSHLQVLPMTLQELLLRESWPAWLHKECALQWGLQVCRMVARLHRLGVILGDVSPTTILVDRDGVAPWTPTLLFSWPPAPCFWHEGAGPFTPQQIYNGVFPILNTAGNNPFIAPELLYGYADERSDVYSLGALLYMFFTRFAPIVALRRMRAEQTGAETTGTSIEQAYMNAIERCEGLELVEPSRLRPGIPRSLERVLLRALALEPEQRFSSAFELVEALEEVHIQDELPVPLEPVQKQRRSFWSGFWRLKRE